MRLNRRTVAVAAMCAVPLLSAPVAAQQQAGAPAAMDVTTASEVARSEYRKAFTDFLNTNPNGARRHASAAVDADPNFGVALSLLARPGLSPDLSAADRTAAANRAVAAAANATALEALLALGTREVIAGRNAVANEIFKAAAALAPNDVELQWINYVGTRGAGGAKPADVIRADREFLAKYDYGPAHNLIAYTLFANGQRADAYEEIAKYVRSNPDQPNSHDTWADLLIMDNRFDEAARHSMASMRIDSTWAGTPLKLGAIQLALGKADSARMNFARAREMASSAAARQDPSFWIATTYVVSHDVKSARRELETYGQIVTNAGMPANAQALVHQRMALVEALIGDKNAVAPHLAKAAEILGQQGAAGANHTAFSALCHAALGDAAQTQADADAFMTAAPNNQFGHTLQALAAITAKNIDGASAHLGAAPPNDLLAAELRAEVAKQQGNNAEARAGKEAVLKRAVKADGAPGVDVIKVFARLRAEKL